MTDEDFISKLQELDALGVEGIPGMRIVLKGQMSRLIALASRGLVAKAAKPRTARTPSLFSDYLPPWWPAKEWQ